MFKLPTTTARPKGILHKDFFFEKKKQKLLIVWLRPFWRERALFWFFFSKKNCLPFL
jgi:hypothetical protein